VPFTQVGHRPGDEEEQDCGGGKERRREPGRNVVLAVQIEPREHTHRHRLATVIQALQDQARAGEGDRDAKQKSQDPRRRQPEQDAGDGSGQNGIARPSPGAVRYVATPDAAAPAQVGTIDQDGHVKPVASLVRRRGSPPSPGPLDVRRPANALNTFSPNSTYSPAPAWQVIRSPGAGVAPLTFNASPVPMFRDRGDNALLAVCLTRRLPEASTLRLRHGSSGRVPLSLPGWRARHLRRGSFRSFVPRARLHDRGSEQE
jgi:hypothetical protein